jgi:sterol desaturase/sphingolipid hydroxylase (fatty acid hydroxylase superfamily)
MAKRRALVELLAGAAAFAAVAALERKWPLRKRREAEGVRLARNAAMFAATAASLAVLQPRALDPFVRRVRQRRQGLLNAVAMPRAMRVAAGVLLLDYTLWWWHRLNHRVPLLWRFHLVHHVDRDLDASTALRFHFGEMTLSMLFRMLQVRVIGADEATLSIWNLLLMPSILFHHSNLRLPAGTDDALARFIVTPRMHGIHHSNVREHADSNWSSLLTLWDRLHGSMRLDVNQESIVIGVPAYEDAQSVTAETIFALPWRKQRDDWNEVCASRKQNAFPAAFD